MAKDFDWDDSDIKTRVVENRNASPGKSNPSPATDEFNDDDIEDLGPSFPGRSRDGSVNGSHNIKSTAATSRMDNGFKPINPGVNWDEEPKTKLYNPHTKDSKAPEKISPSSVSRMDSDPSHEQPSIGLVVGWLVVIDGPGKGNSLPLGYGMNSIGRGDNQRVRINFGDSLISRENHVSIAYSDRGRKFFITHGGGLNLTHINDIPLMAPTELSSGTDILIGDTKLRFIALCGKDFDWSEL